MSMERAGLGQLSKSTNFSFSLLPLDLRGNLTEFSEEIALMGIRSACEIPAQPSYFSYGAPLASLLAMMKDRSFFESAILVSLLPSSEADFPLSSSSIRMASLFPRSPRVAITAARLPFIPPCWFFLFRSFRLALALDLLLCSFRGSCWCCLYLALAFVFLPLRHLVRYGVGHTGGSRACVTRLGPRDIDRRRPSRLCRSGCRMSPLKARTEIGGLVAWSTRMQRARQRSVYSAWGGLAS